MFHIKKGTYYIRGQERSDKTVHVIIYRSVESSIVETVHFMSKLANRADVDEALQTVAPH